MRERVLWVATFAVIAAAFAVVGPRPLRAPAAAPARVVAVPEPAARGTAVAVPPAATVTGSAPLPTPGPEPAEKPAPVSAAAEPSRNPATVAPTAPDSLPRPVTVAPTLPPTIAPAASPAISAAVSEGMLDAAVRRYERAVISGSSADGLFASRCSASPAAIVLRKRAELAAEAGSAVARIEEAAPAIGHFDLLEAHVWMGFTIAGALWRPHLPDWWLYEDGGWRNADC